MWMVVNAILLHNSIMESHLLRIYNSWQSVICALYYSSVAIPYIISHDIPNDSVFFLNLKMSHHYPEL